MARPHISSHKYTRHLAAEPFVLQLGHKLVHIGHGLSSFPDWGVLHWYNLPHGIIIGHLMINIPHTPDDMDIMGKWKKANTKQKK